MIPTGDDADRQPLKPRRRLQQAKTEQSIEAEAQAVLLINEDAEGFRLSGLIDVLLNLERAARRMSLRARQSDGI